MGRGLAKTDISSELWEGANSVLMGGREVEVAGQAIALAVAAQNGQEHLTVLVGTQ